ncbi:unnamed protein product, partial [Rotaria sordida]
ALECDKNTTIQLIERIYDYSHGNIVYLTFLYSENKRNIQQIHVKDLRSQMALIS